MTGMCESTYAPAAGDDLRQITQKSVAPRLPASWALPG
jgi:hypothetical protein